MAGRLWVLWSHPKPQPRLVCQGCVGSYLRRVVDEHGCVTVDVLTEGGVIVVPAQLHRSAALVSLPCSASAIKALVRTGIACSTVACARTCLAVPFFLEAIAPRLGPAGRCCPSACRLVARLAQESSKLELILVEVTRIRKAGEGLRCLNKGVVSEEVRPCASRIVDIREEGLEIGLREPGTDTTATGTLRWRRRR